jgi:hypothetical protein
MLVSSVNQVHPTHPVVSLASFQQNKIICYHSLFTLGKSCVVFDCKIKELITTYLKTLINDKTAVLFFKVETNDSLQIKENHTEN